MRRGFPQSVCFRVTRACNARCGFCLAPWDGEHPPADVLLHRVDWLISAGEPADRRASLRVLSPR
jgi:hypothetical protein